MKENFILATGKRKTAVARARIKKGEGTVIINKKPLDILQSQYSKIWEALILSDEAWKKLDIKVSVRGGGVSSRSDAVRQAIAKGMVEFLKDEKLKSNYLKYDKNLLVYDKRRTEPHKPSRSRKGARRHKQRSKR